MDRGTCPIIIGGCHRSGTSLVRRMLDAHPRIHCGPEVKFFRDFFGHYFQDPIAHIRYAKTARAILDEDELLKLLGGTFVMLHERAAARAGKARWADKNPENTLYLDQWEKLLGNNWLYLHVARNPLDTLASIKDHPFPHTIPAALDERIAYYLNYLRTGTDYVARYPKRARVLIYETLVAEPEETTRQLMTWMGEELSAAQLILDNTRHEQGIEDPKIRAMRRISRAGVGRWRANLAPDEAEKIWADTAASWEAVDTEKRFTPRLDRRAT